MTRLASIVASLALAGGAALAAGEPADLILHNAKVYTVEEGRPLAQAVAVRGDRKSTRLNSSHIQKSRMPSSA